MLQGQALSAEDKGPCSVLVPDAWPIPDTWPLHKVGKKCLGTHKAGAGRLTERMVVAGVKAIGANCVPFGMLGAGQAHGKTQTLPWRTPIVISNNGK